jgi:hypothetical protein
MFDYDLLESLSDCNKIHYSNGEKQRVSGLLNRWTNVTAPYGNRDVRQDKVFIIDQKMILFEPKSNEYYKSKVTQKIKNRLIDEGHYGFLLSCYNCRFLVFHIWNYEDRNYSYRGHTGITSFKLNTGDDDKINAEFPTTYRNEFEKLLFDYVKEHNEIDWEFFDELNLDKECPFYLT